MTAPPLIQVLDEPDHRGRPVTIIIQRHALAPHDVTGRVQIDAPSQLQQLIRSLKFRLDIMLEDRRARVRPETCHGGGQVPRRLTLDEMDGDA